LVKDRYGVQLICVIAFDPTLMINHTPLMIQHLEHTISTI